MQKQISWWLIWCAEEEGGIEVGIKRVVIEENIANAKELYRRIECGACCAAEFEYAIKSILNNIEETSFVFFEKDLNKSIEIRDEITESATLITCFFEHLRNLLYRLSKIQDTLCAYGMTEESDHLLQLIDDASHGIRSKEELKAIIDEANWAIGKLVAVGAYYDYMPIEYWYFTESYCDSRIGYENLKLHLLEYIDMLQHYAYKFKEILEIAQPMTVPQPSRVD